MFRGLLVFGRTHEHTQNAAQPSVCGWPCGFAVLFSGNSDAPCNTTGGGGGRQLTMLKLLTLALLLLLLLLHSQMFVLM